MLISGRPQQLVNDFPPFWPTLGAKTSKKSLMSSRPQRGCACHACFYEQYALPEVVHFASSHRHDRFSRGGARGNFILAAQPEPESALLRTSSSLQSRWSCAPVPQLKYTLSYKDARPPPAFSLMPNTHASYAHEQEGRLRLHTEMSCASPS